MAQVVKKQVSKKQLNNIVEKKENTDDLFLTISINDLNEQIVTEPFSYRKQTKLEKLAKECDLPLESYLRKKYVNLVQTDELLRKFELTVNLPEKEKIVKEIVLTFNQYKNYLNLANKKNLSLIDYLLNKICVIEYKKYNFIYLLNDTNATFLDKVPIQKETKSSLMSIAKDCQISVEQLIFKLFDNIIKGFYKD